MAEITELLRRARADEPAALDKVFGLLHADLKRLAASKAWPSQGQTMTPTAIVNELYLKFIGAKSIELKDRAHFMTCAAAAMRQILVDDARAKSAAKRGGEALRVTLTDIGETQTHTELLALDDALGKLGSVEPDWVDLVNLKFFAGLTMDEIAEAQNRSVRSVHRDWSAARAFLNARMTA